MDYIVKTSPAGKHLWNIIEFELHENKTCRGNTFS